MPPTLTLWTHALAALLFGSLALAQLRQGGGGLPRATFVVALGTTALWALAVAGIESRDVAVRVAEGVRNLAWLAFMYALVRRDRARAPDSGVAVMYGVVTLVVLVTIALAIVEAQITVPAAVQAVAAARLAFRMLAAVAALLLVHHLQASASSEARGGMRVVALALAILWGIDLALFATVYVTGRWPLALINARGAAMIVLAPLFGLAVQRDGAWRLQISRTVAFQSLSVVVIGIYVVVTGLATGLLAEFGGRNARVLQTAFVFGTTAALLTIVSTPWLRAWGRVLVAKHLFSHRYDYRAEWVRFTDTLGEPGEGAAPLDVRVVKAVADLTESPAGLLLVPDRDGLDVGANWNWPADDLPDRAGAAVLVAHLAETRRIIELDAVRAGHADAADSAVVPAWMRVQDSAWAVVPLLHFGRLLGAIVLARPPVDRALDWEDFDLLGIAGRQVASYLAEDHAHDALADAQRFDEFNRRFAFILHDLKNLVSQLTLVARNAERHADNPAFRADMVATLKDSSDRMNSLLARLSQHHTGRGAAVRAVAVLPLLERIAAARRAQHPVIASGTRDAQALADPVALETLLGHLVQNAIEASQPTRPVTLTVTVVAGRVAIEVADHGCGMAPAFVRDQLFKPFVSAKSGGFGLGAFEARQLAEAMAGRIDVTSREGEGTRFTVTLPGAVEQRVEEAA